MCEYADGLKMIYQNVKTESDETASGASSHDDCPLDKSELGRNTWSFLHTMAEYYPNSPSTSEKADMKKFITTLSQFYPCDYCAKDFRNEYEFVNVQLLMWSQLFHCFVFIAASNPMNLMYHQLMDYLNTSVNSTIELT